MKRYRFRELAQWGYHLLLSFIGAVTFYTCIPIPANCPLEFRRIARWAPLMGLLIGGLLGIFDLILQQVGVPILTRSAVIIASWIAITGGLHLDGVMDTADGLAVPDKERRLAVMTDSATGAFGAMAAIALLLLKTAALTDIETNRSLALMAAAGWGRWGQVIAIAFYPYLKPTGKGAFHKQAIRQPNDALYGLVFLLILCSVPLLQRGMWWVALEMAIGGSAIAYLTGVWFNRQLGGHTGDTYGAVVEWTEALFLCLFTSL
ncbi:MAG: adenosylcobinamide-GDP ribazoletransferase [Coleofasciculaceae cyanobacterium]